MIATTYFTDSGTVSQLCAIVLKDSQSQKVITCGSVQGMMDVLARLGDQVKVIRYGGKQCPELAAFYS